MSSSSPAHRAASACWPPAHWLGRVTPCMPACARQPAATRRRSAEAQTYAAEHAVDLRTIELDVASEASADAAIKAIVTAHARLDVVIHNAGHMVFGPA